MEVPHSLRSAPFVSVLAGIALTSEPVKFTVVGIDCEACGPPIVKALKGEERLVEKAQGRN